MDELLNGFLLQLKPYNGTKKAISYTRKEKVRPLIKYIRAVFKDGFDIKEDKETQKYIIKILKKSGIFEEEWNKKSPSAKD